MVPENEVIVRRFLEEFWSDGDLSVADALVAADHVHHLGDEELRGPGGVKGAVLWLRTAFPNLRFEIDDVISDGDRVVVRWTAMGIHEGGSVMSRRRDGVSSGLAATGSASVPARSSRRL